MIDHAKARSILRRTHYPAGFTKMCEAILDFYGDKPFTWRGWDSIRAETGIKCPRHFRRIRRQAFIAGILISRPPTDEERLKYNIKGKRTRIKKLRFKVLAKNPKLPSSDKRSPQRMKGGTALSDKGGTALSDKGGTTLSDKGGTTLPNGKDLKLIFSHDLKGGGPAPDSIDVNELIISKSWLPEPTKLRKSLAELKQEARLERIINPNLTEEEYDYAKPRSQPRSH